MIDGRTKAIAISPTLLKKKCGDNNNITPDRGQLKTLMLWTNIDQNRWKQSF